MLRRFVGNGWGSFSQAEMASVQELAGHHEQLLHDGGFADVRSEAGYAACATFLTTIDKVAKTFGSEVAPRTYRSNFTANYRALFPDGSRHYRVDVFEASVDQHSAIWVNGDKFELSGEAITFAETLQQAWADLGGLMQRWRTTRSAEVVGAVTRPTRSEVAAGLVAMDISWAQFECKYISELIAIEEQARQFVVKAVKFEQQLRSLPKGTPEFRKCEQSLVVCVAHLNSVANFKRKGRDDLSYNILESAREVMHRCSINDISGASRDAAHILASDVVSAFDAMRNYLFEVGACLERVDPHLCNNSGLVARLVDWEESWEVGLRYVQELDMFESVIQVVAEFTDAQRLVPELCAMCEDCDVELFLVLPRIVLLSFFADSSSLSRATLLKSLIPHRFGAGQKAADGSMTAATGKIDPDLIALVGRFTEASRILQNLPPNAPLVAKGPAWEVLVKRAVLGGSEPSKVYGQLSAQHRKVVEDLMRDIERWSLELQRHCPEDWNQFSAVLVQCLTGGSPKVEAAPEFEV